MRWLAICDASDAPMHRRPPPPKPMPELLGVGTLVLECALATPPAAPLDLIAQDETRDWRRELRLTLAPDGTLTLHQRQGAGTASVALPLTLPRDMQGLCILYSWDAPRRSSHLTARILPAGPEVSIAGRNPLPIPAEDLIRLFTEPGAAQRHGAVSWLGLADVADPPPLRPGISAGLPVLTPSGHVRADSLHPGDLVETAMHGMLPLRSVTRIHLPAQGSFTPVRLRTPYFGIGHDLIVSPGQRVALSGAEVEYLFGEEEVLVAARHLVNGRSAVHETRRPFVTYLSLGFEVPTAILAMECLLECPADPAITGRADLRDLERYEAVTLQHMREGQQALNAA
ncbi:Hint domain-containing protein [Acidimangrovimonas sediminis]|uniref:Hint domain-containing protein n=1 Tax=Acidimangrovimonas sediminis TaxID=2056283 RepID=UPI0011AF7207|nr:Hint domain-containing protein [Acidimangrovimonas sediminis]